MSDFNVCFLALYTFIVLAVPENLIMTRNGLEMVTLNWSYFHPSQSFEVFYYEVPNGDQLSIEVIGATQTNLDIEAYTNYTAFVVAFDNRRDSISLPSVPSETINIPPSKYMINIIVILVGMSL